MRRASVIGLVTLCALSCQEEPRPTLEPLEIPQQADISPIQATEPARPWNVVLISIDTLRADRLFTYGWKKPTSPRIDQLAAEGVLFEDAYSQSPKTAESHMSIMTGLYPSTHRVQNFVKDSTPLHGEIPTLAEILKAAGYRTEAYTGAGNTKGALGFARGFDIYSEHHLYRTPHWSFEEAAKAIDTLAADQPFFLFTHTFKVHDPYAPPARYLKDLVDPDYEGPVISSHEELMAIQEAGGNLWEEYWDGVDIHDPEDLQRLSDLYDAEIRFTDDRVRALLDRLRARGLDRNTLIILVSDHGEEFMEHGYYLHERLYNELLHVPLVVRFPTDDPDAPDPGTRVEGIVRMVDLVPTVLEYLGLPIPAHLQGESLLDAAATGDAGERFLLSQWYQGKHGVLRVGPWKFYRRMHFAGLFSIGRWKFFYKERVSEELYDLANDPGETENLSWSESGILDEMKGRLGALESVNQEFREELPEEDATKAIEMDEDTIEELKALGYL